MAKRDLFAEVTGAFKVEVLKISRHKRVLEGIAKVVKCLVYLLSPFSAELPGFHEEDGIELYQADDYVAAHSFELRSHWLATPHNVPKSPIRLD